jgi:hypothetical protein
MEGKMRKSLAILSCLTLVGTTVALTSQAYAETGGFSNNGGAMQPPSANYTGNHAPNNGTGGDATNPPSANYDNDNTATGSGYDRRHSSTQAGYQRYNNRYDNNSSNGTSGMNESTGNDNPNLNSGNRGGGQPR